MTTKAIEAGALEAMAQTLACAHSPDALTAYRAGAGPAVEYWNKLATAAISSSALVPAVEGLHEARATDATNRVAKLVSMSPEVRDDVHGIIQEALSALVPAVAEREAIARIIDRWAWENRDLNFSHVSVDDRVNESLAKADRIRALVPAAQLAVDHFDHLEGGLQLLLKAAKAGDPHNEIVWRAEEELRQIARICALEPASGEYVVVLPP